MASEEKSRPAWSNGDVPKVRTKDDEAKELQEERRKRTPFFYCRWIARRPFLIFFLTLTLQLVPVLITLIMIGAKYDLFPTNFEVLPMELYDIPYRLRDYAYQDRDLYNDRIKRDLIDTGYPTYERGLSFSYANLELFFDAEGGNIITKANLQTIKYIEEYLMEAEEYKTSYCLTYNSSLACKPPTSLLRYFDGTYASISQTFNDPTFSNIVGVLYEAFTNNETSESFRYFLPKSYTITPTSVSFSITRTKITIGCSLTGSTTCKLMKEMSKTFLGKKMKPRLDNLREDISGFDFYYMSNSLLVYEILMQAMKDMLFALGSMAFIFCFMVFHTRSLFISGLAVMSILTSFAGTNILYRCILDFQYVGFFHILAIFIILGIGADDLFVFYDAWRLTAFSPYSSIAHRLTDAYLKSCKSMFITSLTTAVAFIASAISPLLATKSFGVFAAILVFYNYLSVVVFFPNVIIVYHLKFEDWKWPCLNCRKKEASVDSNSNKTKKKRGLPSKVVPENAYVASTVDKSDENSFTRADFVLPPSRLNPINAKALSEKSNKIQNSANDSFNDVEKEEVEQKLSVEEKLKAPCIPKTKKKEKRLVVFFRDRYFRFITSKWVRMVLIPIFIAVVSVFGYFASTLEPDNEDLQLYKDTHHFSKAKKAQEYTMLVSTDDSLVKIHGVWGLKNKDRSDCHFSSIECRGTNQYDANFDPNPVANQQALMDFCDRLYNFSTSDIAKYKIRTDSSGQMQVACFTRDLNTFLQSKSAAIGIGDLSLPWDYSKTINFMNALPTYYDTTSFTNSFTDYLAIPIGYWLYNEFGKTYTADYGYHDELIGEYKKTSGFTKQLKTDSSIYYGTKLKYITVEINTTINRKTTGYSVGIPLVELWENYFNSEVSKMPDGLKSGFQLTFRTWHWFYVQKSLADNAIQGLIIGVSLAFPILTLTTMNFIIGFLATLSICCTTVCVIGVIPLAGWKLGLLVSLNMCMLVGLAVDYVVHLAEGYHLSLHKDRLNRTRDMLEEMGTSVFSGACTTLGASTFMFFAIVQFFMQFGIFLFCTIGFSLFFSLGLFTLLMGLCGPENNTGSLKPLFEKCRSICCKKKVEENKDIPNGNLNAAISTPSIATVGSQHNLIENQVPPHITKINVNGFQKPRV